MIVSTNLKIFILLSCVYLFCNAQAIAFNLNRFRRTLGNSSSSHAFTPHGLAVYTDSMIQYLTTMRDRQIMMMAPGVNVLNQEETDRLFATYDEPINDRTWSSST